MKKFLITILLSALTALPAFAATAADYYRIAAENAKHDDPQAQCLLGMLHLYGGDGVSKDHHEAVKWFRKAAEQGYAPAQFRLGLCYAQNIGVSKDMAEAVKWFRKAAEQGYHPAQYSLGVCYAQGIVVSKDMAEAIKWYRKAAKQGNQAAKKALNDLGETW